jgi:phospholipid/cholesterol/gamma-HCH transport system permease protein
MQEAQAKFLLPSEITPNWISRNQRALFKQLKKADLRLDCKNLRTLNSLGVAFFTQLHQHADKIGSNLVLKDFPENLKNELTKAGNLLSHREMPSREKQSFFYKIGESTVYTIGSAKDLIHLLSECLYWSTFGLFRKKTTIAGATVNQMILLGSSSLPIVLLLSFLIGLTLAIQSAVQLEKFGASLYIASGIGISMVTEIGPLMTSVILAGRSGSAVTAEISTMVVQEELRALQTMAINPIHFLLLPRFWAMTITLPLLVICADVIGIFAGLIVSFFYAGIPVQLFFHELSNAVTPTMLVQSMIKSVTFAWLIMLIATYKGFNAKGGADAVGKATTSCVVTCLFSIICADAVFSFIFYF